MTNRSSSHEWACNTACQDATHPPITRAREILPKLVKRACHDTVSRVERFFDAITVMDVNVNVQHALVDSVNTTVSRQASKALHTETAGYAYLSSSRMPSTQSLT